MNSPEPNSWPAEAQAEIARLNRIIRVLMDRAERSTGLQDSDFSLFQTAVLLEEQVRRRTDELESALLENRRINRALHESEEKLKEQATHDRLTGLYNRLFLDDNFERELALARRHAHPISVVMADLDHFKRVNDQYGHQAGDAVLKEFAAVVRRHSRASDICCRYGGEEFLLILPEMTADQARNKAEQLRASIEAGPISFGGQLIRVTASFGIACFPTDGPSADSLVSAADAALYAAKAGGRNQVRVSAAAGAA